MKMQASSRRSPSLISFLAFYLLGAVFAAGLVISFVADSFFSVWVGIEVSMLSIFCSMVWNEKTELSYSVGIKFFIMQVVGSMCLLMGVLICGDFLGVWIPALALVLIALNLKLGGLFLGWLLSLMENCSWSVLFVVLGLANLPIVPLFLMLPELCGPKFVVWTFMFCGVWVVWAYYHVSVRSVIVVSSAVNGCWFGSGFSMSYASGMVYFVVYLLVFWLLCSILENNDRLMFNGVFSEGLEAPLVVILATLSGFPPFLLFFPNVSVLLSLVSENIIMESIGLVLISLIMLGAYVYVILAVVFSSHETNVVNWGFNLAVMVMLPFNALLVI